jgi:hypothetical protein
LQGRRDPIKIASDSAGLIASERWRDCTLVNPWPGKAVVGFRAGKKIETLQGGSC